MSKAKKKNSEAIVQATVNLAERFAVANENYTLGWRAGVAWAITTLRDEHKNLEYLQTVLDRTKTARMCP